MNIGTIKKEVEKYHGIPPNELINDLDIKVVEHRRMDDKDNDAVLITGKSKSILYIKRNLPLNYKNFLILHEVGHRTQHFQEDARYSFLQNQYTGRMEREANAFACLCLLQDEDLEDVCVIELLVSKGVPCEIAVQFTEDFE